MIALLHYIYDPLCGWCYAAAPLIAAARDAEIPIALHGGGLWAEPSSLRPDKAAYIRASDARIASLTGQPFGLPYLDGLLSDPATTLWSRPTIAAVLAAGRLRQGADLDMLHAIQEAHYVDGRPVVDEAVLEDLSAKIGLQSLSFRTSLEADDGSRHIAATRALMDRNAVRGFPAFLFESAAGILRMPHESFYGRPEAFVAAIHDQSDVVRQPVGDERLQG